MDALDYIIVSIKEMESWREIQWCAENVTDDSFIVHWDGKGWGVACIGVGVWILL